MDSTTKALTALNPCHRLERSFPATGITGAQLCIRALSSAFAIEPFELLRVSFSPRAHQARTSRRSPVAPIRPPPCRRPQPASSLSPPSLAGLCASSDVLVVSDLEIA